MVDSALNKFAKSLAKSFLMEPETIYDIVSETVSYYMGKVRLEDIIHVLDNNVSIQDIFQKIPQDIFDKVRQLMSSLDENEKQQIYDMAYRFMTPDNVLLWIKQNNITVYGIIINHRNGRVFITNFTRYLLENLKNIIG